MHRQKINVPVMKTKPNKVFLELFYNAIILNFN